MKKRDIKIVKYPVILVGIILLLSSTIAMAQSSGNIQSSGVSVGEGKVISWDNIPKGNAGISNGKEIPMRYVINKNELQELKRRPSAPPSGKIVPKEEKDASVSASQSHPLQPSLSSSFDSLDNWVNANLNGYIVRPADPVIAAGPNHVGVMVNEVIAFYNKSGSLMKQAALQNWYSSVLNGACSSCMITDPRIAYDQNENHWIALALGINMSTSPWTSYFLLSVSKTADPTDTWFGYIIPSNIVVGTVKTWSDYPDLGFDGISNVSGGAIYITSNQFDTNGNYQTAAISILPKSKLYAGSGSDFWSIFGMTNADGTPADTLRAAQTFGNPGVEYLVNSENSGVGNNVTLWSVAPAYPPDTVNLVQAVIPIGTYSMPPSAKQKGGASLFLLDTIDNRMYNAVYKNGSLYTAFTEAHDWGNGTVASIRYLQLNTTTNSSALNIQYGADGKYYWFPAITTDNYNNINLVFSYSSPTEYAGIGYTTKKTDTVTEPSVLLKAGQVTIQGFRWGDYFGIAKDPSDNGVWIYGQYAKNLRGISKTWTWGTFVGKIVN